jgi:L-seryl-tRNA(Ser) seleniumtransferase
LSLAALEATLRIYRQERGAREQIPVLAMLSTPVEVVAQRARRLIELMGTQAASAFRPQIERGTAEAGGGSLPGISLPTYWVRMKPVSVSVQSLESKLREGNPPILARIKKESLILDLLTVGEEELELIANRLCELATSQIG